MMSVVVLSNYLLKKLGDDGFVLLRFWI